MEDFVTYEQSAKLKELGFNWECTNYYLGHNQQLREWDGKILDYYHIRWDYNYTEYIIGLPDTRENLFEDDFSAPTLAQAQKWLREVKEIDIIIFPIIPNDIKKYHWVIDKDNDLDFRLSSEELYSTYEQALSGGIDKVLGLLKEK